MGMRKARLRIIVLCFLLSTVSGFAESGGGEAPGPVSCRFEPDDVMATGNGEEWQSAKILTVAVESGKETYHVLFADGEEAWIGPECVIRFFRPIDRKELKIGQRVLFTTEEPEDWPDRSIRFSYFSKGKITGAADDPGMISVNAYEVMWDKQVLIY